MRNILEEALKVRPQEIKPTKTTEKTNLVCIQDTISTSETMHTIYSLKNNPDWKLVSVSTA